MNLQAIRQQFVDLGYFCPVYGDSFVVGDHPTHHPDFPEIGSYQASYSIEIKGDVIVIEDIRSQIPKKEEFGTQAEAIAFVTSRFPI